MDNKSNLHDAAADIADRSIPALNDLVAEGIPERAARLRAEIYSILEACWLVGDIQRTALCSGSVGDSELVDHAWKMYYQCAGLEVHAMAAVNALEMFTSARQGDDLDNCFGTVMTHKDPQWVRDYFIGIYSDSDREGNVAMLNAILQAPTSPRAPEQGSNNNNGEAGK